MNTIAPFKTGERVCFIGDSITEATLWIAHIADYYANSTDLRPRIYPCGIAGGSAQSSIDYFNEQTAVYKPDTAVIMLGMNDIDRHLYGKAAQDKAQQAARLEDYKIRLCQLTEKLEKIGVKRIIYASPTPYDEEQDCAAENLVGCQAALGKCADILKDLGQKKGYEFVDLGGEMLRFVHVAHQNKSKNGLVGPDRVHPTPLGHSCMARLFLAAQGFCEMSPKAESIVDGSALLELSVKGQAFKDAAFSLQRRWTVEFLIARNSPDKSTEGKLSYVKEYISRQNDKFFADLARSYEPLVKNEKKNQRTLEAAIDKMYEE